MFNTILNYTKEQDLIHPHDRLLLGFSGGPDSVFLLHFFQWLSKTYDLDLALAYMNHGLRGKDSLKEQAFIQDMAKQFKLKLFFKKINGSLIKGNLEAGCRDIRYDFFCLAAKKWGTKKIVLGHHKDDQVETVLMHIMRGSGLKGLIGLQPKFYNHELDLEILRPLLCVEKKEIQTYLDKEKISYIHDYTNLDKKFKRNHIRLELIPYLEKNFNLQIKDHLISLSQIAHDYYDFTNEIVKDFYSKYVIKIKQGYCKISKRKLETLKPVLRKELLFQILSDLNGQSCGFQESHLNEIDKMIKTLKANGSIDLPYGIKMEKQYDDLIFFIGSPLKKENLLTSSVNLNLPGYALFEGEKITAQFVCVKKFISKDKNSIFCDADKIKGAIKIRTRKDGDKFIPFGQEKFKKLKDLFINEKIPLKQRDKMPILEDDEKIIWVAGLRMDERVRCDQGTKKVVKIKIKLC